MIKKYNIAGVTLELDLSMDLLNEINDELKIYETNEFATTVDISIHQVNDISNVPFIGGSNEVKISRPSFFRGSTYFVAGEYFYVYSYPLNFAISRKGKTYIIYLSISKPHTIVEKVYDILFSTKLLSPSFISSEENIASKIIYGFINTFLELKLLEKGYTFFHSSSVGLNNKGVLLPSWGGVGKTTLSSSLILKHGYCFVSDDLTVVGHGKVFPNITHLFIYPYNKDLVKATKLSVFEKIKWNVYSFIKMPQLRYRISPFRIFKRVCTTPLTFGTLLFLRRGTYKKVSVIKADKKELIPAIRDILLIEFRFLFDMITVTNSAGCKVFPKFDTVLSKLDNILDGILTKNCFIVNIPLNFKANNLVETLNLEIREKLK